MSGAGGIPVVHGGEDVNAVDPSISTSGKPEGGDAIAVSGARPGPAWAHAWPSCNAAAMVGLDGLAEAVQPLQQSFNALTAAANRVAESYFAQFGKLVHAFGAAYFPARHRRCRACQPWTAPAPLCVDGREYQRRQKARRRRGR